MRDLMRRAAAAAGAVAVVLSSVMGVAAAPGASAAGGAPTSGRAAEPPFAYVANSGNGTVWKVDTADNTRVGNPISVGGSPRGVAVSPDGSHVYVTNTASPGWVSVIDTEHNNSVTRITENIGADPQGVAVSPDGSRVYVANNLASGWVSVIDTKTDSVTRTTTIANAYGVAVSPDGSRVYVTRSSATAPGVSVINVANNDAVTNLWSPSTSAFRNSRGIAISPDGRLYVANFATNNVAVLNPATSPPTVTNISLSPASAPQSVAISPDGSHVYVANISLNNQVSVINVADNNAVTTLSSTLFTRPEFLAVTPDGSRVYVSNTGGSTLAMINPANNNAVTTALAGLASPAGIAFVPTFVPPTVYAGYTDGYRMNANDHPDPWQGSDHVIFVGCNVHTPTTCSTGAHGPIYDAGAIRIDNTTGQEMTVTDASVTAGGCDFTHQWQGLDESVPAGDSLVLTQTGGPAQCPGTGGRQAQNFDTSEVNHLAGTAKCTEHSAVIPEFHVTVNGEALTYHDTQQILNTGGKDPGAANCGSHNETHNWSTTPMEPVTP